MLSTGCWTDLIAIPSRIDSDVIARVERWRGPVKHALSDVDLSETKRSLTVNLEIALATMACESKGNPDVVNNWGRKDGLYQIVPSTWAGTPQKDESRSDPRANILAMTYLVEIRGWQPWSGGTLKNGMIWGSGPDGAGCWKYPDE